MKYNLKLFIGLAFACLGHLAACGELPGYASPPRISESTLSGKAYVYDGDSLFIGSSEIRLAGIDAPEHDQACRDGRAHFFACGLAARDALRAMLAGQNVNCIVRGKDKYRRSLATCYAGAVNLNASMVRQGYAAAYHYFSEEYAGEERAARKNHLQIWQDAGVTAPYFCRHLTAGHVCYRYDFRRGTGIVATVPLTGKTLRGVSG